MRLRHECLGACAAITRNASAWVVFALAAFRWVIGSDGERVAFVAPVAIVIAGAGILIEVTIGLAR